MGVKPVPRGLLLCSVRFSVRVPLKYVACFSYASNMRRLSAIFHDQPETPLERAVYWTEYVLRHGGAPHLRSVAVDLPLYQYLLLDVGLVLLLLLGTVLAALVLLTRLLWRVVRNKSKQKQQ
uniref:Uncharacterized protein n=1 Tax=Timema bartmani TaxID=61472 RepID=A0A7R9ENV7_9NEOP|nr:unnamed protein product [Timema bartmani]